jgi:hypothetical protein
LRPIGLGQHTLDHQGVVDKADLQQVNFLGGVQQEMSEALTMLDRSLPKNPHVKILQKRHGWIALSPLNAQPEPVNLRAKQIPESRISRARPLPLSDG